MMNDRIKRVEAQDGEDCVYCGHPFDVGDPIVVLVDLVYCSRQCMLKHEGIEEK